VWPGRPSTNARYLATALERVGRVLYNRAIQQHCHTRSRAADHYLLLDQSGTPLTGHPPFPTDQKVRVGILYAPVLDRWHSRNGENSSLAALRKRSIGLDDCGRTEPRCGAEDDGPEDRYSCH
jgi:hypothetical protein